MNRIHTILTALILAALMSFSSCGDDSDDDDEATATGPGNAPALGDQIDRAGRAAISTALISPFAGDEDKTTAKNGYNQAGTSKWSEYISNIAGNVAILDAVVGTCGDNKVTANQDSPTAEGAYNGFATALADDQLYINSAATSCNQYLAQELVVLGVLPSTEECGGRTLTMDVVETSYSALAAGATTGVDDEVSEDDATHSNTDFPFVAAPL